MKKYASMKKILITSSLLLLMIGCTPDETEYKSQVPVSEPLQNVAEVANTEIDQVQSSTVSDGIPAAFNLDVQFYSQAPKADWGMPYQEACEEASLILAYNYVTYQTMTLDEFDKAIRGMVDWQVATYGSHKDVSIEEVATILEKYLGFSNYEIVDNPTPKIIKEYLAQGYPIVAPFAGRQLGNPFFTQPGPIYHMLVIKGYEETENGLRFITNDVGTRRGGDYVYSESTLMDSLHDWVPGSLENQDLMNRGVKRILVLKRN